MKKLLLFGISCILLITQVQAQFSGGSGTEADPYQIRTPQELSNLRNYLGYAHLDKYYLIMNDIDLFSYIDARGWKPIGAEFFQYGPEMRIQESFIGLSWESFTGRLDGGGHTISGFWAHGGDYSGLFSSISGAEIKNLNIKVHDYGITAFYSNGCIGILSAFAAYSYIENCHVEGYISIYSEVKYTGGLIGCTGKEMYIYNCSANVKIDGVSCVGGLVGFLYENSYIQNCYANCDIISAGNSVGGLVGFVELAAIYDSYSTGYIWAYPQNGAGGVGGLVGTICGSGLYHCYTSTQVNCNINQIGGLVGVESQLNYIPSLTINRFISCYFDKEKTGQTYGVNGRNVDGIAGKTTAEMKKQATFVEWDFHNTWVLYENQTFPHFPVSLKNGSGTVSDPFLISTAEELDVMRYYLGPNHADKHFKIINDIDLTDFIGTTAENPDGWIPIGYYTKDGINPFQGKLDGRGYTISGLRIKRVDFFQGLFNVLRGATIENLNIKTHETGIEGRSDCGILAGCISDGNIKGCHVEGYVSGVGSQYVGHFRAGGIAARADNTNFSLCSAKGGIKGYYYVGGLLGVVDGCSINNCYSDGNVRGGQVVGGLLGSIERSTVKNCYSTGSVNGFSEIGGLIGRSMYCNIQDSYTSSFVGSSSPRGGLVGSYYSPSYINSNTFTSCYFDIQATGQTYGVQGINMQGVIGKTTAEMKRHTTFFGWDFVNIWKIKSDQTYPYFFDPFYEGKGTSSNPFIIATSEDLDNVRYYTGAEHSNKYFKVINNIDLTTFIGTPEKNPEGWKPIGTVTDPFCGHIEGQGFAISGLRVDRSTSYNVGLFGNTHKANISNIAVHVDKYLSVKGGSYVGILSGYSNQDTISNCYTFGEVQGRTHVGGFTGQNTDGVYKNCYTIAKVKGEDYVGGFTGQNSGSISNVYSASEVNGYSMTGSLIGRNTITGRLINSYYDTNIVHNNSQKSIGSNDNPNQANNLMDKNTSQLQTQTTFNQWDFQSAWSIWNKKSYPYFTSQSSPVYISNIASNKTQLTGSCRPSINIDSIIVYRKTTSGTTFIKGDKTTDTTWTASLSTEALDGEIFWAIAHERNKKTSYPTSFCIKFPIDSGSITHPFEIRTPKDIDNLRNYLGKQHTNTHFRLMNDIDLSDYIDKTYGTTGWIPIGEYASGTNELHPRAFQGILHGGGFTISGLYSSQSTLPQMGLFGFIYNANIDSIGVNTRFDKGIKGSNGGTGILAGQMKDSELKYCYSSGIVEGLSYVGGLVGWNEGGRIYSCYSTSANVRGTMYVGGLIGQNKDSDSSRSVIKNCYSANIVSGNRKGGFIGWNRNSINITNCVFDKQLVDASTKAIGLDGTPAQENNILKKTTWEMQIQSNFANWSFDTVWSIWEEKSYPFFRFQSSPVFIYSSLVNNLEGTHNLNMDSIVIYSAGSKRIGKAILSGNNWTFTGSKFAEAGDIVCVATYQMGKRRSYPILTAIESSGNSMSLLKSTLQEEERFTSNFKIDTIVSVEIYPNPATNAVTIHIKNTIATDVELEVYNKLGQLVLKQPILAALPNNISLSVLSKGSYIIKIITDRGELLTKKLIVQ